MPKPILNIYEDFADFVMNHGLLIHKVFSFGTEKRVYEIQDLWVTIDLGAVKPDALIVSIFSKIDKRLIPVYLSKYVFLGFAEIINLPFLSSIFDTDAADIVNKIILLEIYKKLRWYYENRSCVKQNS